MHFFWGGDMPHYSPPLPFQQDERGERACWPVSAGGRCGVCGQARCPGPHPGCPDSPTLLASLCSRFSGVFQFLDRFISPSGQQATAIADHGSLAEAGRTRSGLLGALEWERGGVASVLGPPPLFPVPSPTACMGAGGRLAP